jgi:ribosome biogenesis protein ENP2
VERCASRTLPFLATVPSCFVLLSSSRFPLCTRPQIIDIQILSDDYSKMVFACADRSLTFHARFGGYVTTRLPKAPRSVAYHAPTADVLAVGSASEVYRCGSGRRCGAVQQLCIRASADTHAFALHPCVRLSLETGRFLTPLPSESPGLNVARVCPTHGLLAAGGEDGALECFDLRAPLATTRLAHASGAKGGGVTCLRFDDSGMTVRARPRLAERWAWHVCCALESTPD